MNSSSHNNLNPVADGTGYSGIHQLWSMARSRSAFLMLLYAPAVFVAWIDRWNGKSSLMPSRRFVNRLIVVYEIIVLLLYLAIPKRRRPDTLSKHVTHLSLSQIDADIRIEKYVRVLANARIPTHVIGATTQLQSPMNFERFGASYAMELCNTRAFTTLWRVEHAVAAIKDEPSVIHANDLSSLLPALVAGRLTGARVVYDAHEVWSQNVDFDAVSGRPIPYSRAKRFLLDRFEWYLSRKADLFVTVNKPIASYYRDRFKLAKEPMVVRNVPLLEMVPERSPIDLKMKLGISSDSFLLGYIGGVGPSRNIETVIEAVGLIKDPRLFFFLMGPKLSSYENQYRNLAVKNGCADKLLIQEGVSMSEVPTYIGGLDAGILMLKNLCMNFYLFLPNKIFEYMAAEIPVLSSNFPVVSQLIDENRIGMTFDPESASQIAATIQAMMLIPKVDRDQMGKRGRRLILDSLNWENESKDYIRSVTELLGRTTRG